MDNDFTLPTEYLRHIADQLRSQDADVEAWLEGAQMSRAELMEPLGVVPFQRFRRLFLDAMRVGREPALGLFVGQRLVASTHGVVGAVAVNSQTVRQALEMMERFTRLRTSILEITYDFGPHEGWLHFNEARPFGEVQRPLLEAVVLSIRNLLDDITMGAGSMLEATFPFDEPEYSSLARELFRCQVHYGQPRAGLRAPSSILDLKLKLANPATFEVAEMICQRELARLAESDSYATRVRRLLLGGQKGFPSLQVTAHLFHMTPRTLHRRLVDEGTSYRQLVESVRHTLAIEQLKSGRVAMDEIAYRLGYSDLSNFRRAFKRWEGVPPSVYRDSAL